MLRPKDIKFTLEGLTSLVDVADRFATSMGGGISALVSLGAIASNVFGKQFMTSIGEKVVNSEKKKMNLANLQAKRDSLATGALSLKESGVEPTAYQIGQLANTEAQLKYMTQIKSIETVLTSEQYNQLVLQEKEMAELARKAALQEEDAKRQLRRLELEDEYINKLMTQDGFIDSEIDAKRQEFQMAMKLQGCYEVLEATLQSIREKNAQGLDTIKEQKDTVSVLAHIYERLDKYNTNETKKEKEQLQLLEKEFKVGQKIVLQEGKLLNYATDRAEAYRGQAATINESSEALSYAESLKQGIAQTKGQQGELESEFNETVDYATKAVQMSQLFSVVTTTASGAITAWNGLNTVISTF